ACARHGRGRAGRVPGRAGQPRAPALHDHRRGAGGPGRPVLVAAPFAGAGRACDPPGRLPAPAEDPAPEPGRAVDLPVRRRRGRGGQRPGQLPDHGRRDRQRARGRQPDRGVLGAGHGRPLHRLLGAALRTGGPGARGVRDRGGHLGLLAATVLEGTAAAVAILSIGLFNSVMFPTIFTLSIDGLGEDTAGGSGLLCLAIVGGAIVPLLMGLVADHVGLALALLVPVACYACIAAYGLMVRAGILSGRVAVAPAET